MNLITYIRNIIGRMWWFFNVDRQVEGRAETKKRANDFCDILNNNNNNKNNNNKNRDVAVVTHGFFMKTFLDQLKRRGFKIKNNGFVLGNLQLVEAEKL